MWSVKVVSVVVCTVIVKIGFLIIEATTDDKWCDH